MSEINEMREMQETEGRGYQHAIMNSQTGQLYGLDGEWHTALDEHNQNFFDTEAEALENIPFAGCEIINI